VVSLFRVPSTYVGESLSWEITPERDSIDFAYYVPYSMERHLDLIADCSSSPLVKSQVLGHTLDGQDLDLLEIGHGAEGRKAVRFIARQHPDGSRRGRLRTNACGTALNREWLDPSMERSPEVFLTRKMMQQKGVDFFIDVHGDEGLPYCFVAGFEGVPNLSEKRIEQFRKYRHTLAQLCPDFQEVHGYDADAPGEANMSMALNYVAEHFDAVTMIMETPFQDNHDLPNSHVGGFSTDRCRHVARGSLEALLQIIDEI
jgi:murein tripeptide amidase MpaA